jgi:hypothetical protein
MVLPLERANTLAVALKAPQDQMGGGIEVKDVEFGSLYPSRLWDECGVCVVRVCV